MPPTTNALTIVLTSLFAAIFGFYLGRWIDSGTVAALAGMLGGFVALVLSHVYQWLKNSKWWQDTSPPKLPPVSNP